MEYNIKEHPFVILLLVAIGMLVGTVVLAYFNKWNIFSIIGICIASLAVIVMAYVFIKDLMIYAKQKREFEENNKDE